MTRYLIQKPADRPAPDPVVHSLLRLGLYIRRRLQQRKTTRVEARWDIYTDCGRRTLPDSLIALRVYVRGRLGKT